MSDLAIVDAPVENARRRKSVAKNPLFVGAAIILVSVNLRPIFSSLSTLLPEIAEQSGLSSFGAGVLTTLPVFFLGVFAPLAPYFARRFGVRNTIFFLLLFLAIGTAARGSESLIMMFIGQGLAGACIAIGNVLLPSLVKREFPEHTGLMTGLYTMALCAGASAGAGMTVPLERAFNGSWAMALAVWAIPAIVAAIFWIPRRQGEGGGNGKGRVAITGLWKSRLAWDVTLFMGLQSAIAYITFGWLAPILRSRSVDAATAGYVVSVLIVAQMVGSLFIPSIAVRITNQKSLNVLLAFFTVIGMLGLIFLPINTVWFWSVVTGLGQGGLVAIALTIIVLRSPNPDVTPYLSGMAQSVGYILAASGPLLVGFIHDATGSYDWVAVLIIILGIGMAFFGFGAGQSRHVDFQYAKQPAKGDRQL